MKHTSFVLDCEPLNVTAETLPLYSNDLNESSKENRNLLSLQMGPWL